MKTRVVLPLIVVFGWGSVSVAEAEIAFTEVSVESGIDRAGESYGASWGDLDGDGYPDLFVSMHRKQPSLFLNDRRGGFIDVGRETFRWLQNPEADTHGGTWFDFDNDGDQDLFVTTGVGNPDQFLVNERGRLVDRTAELGLEERSWGGRLPIWMDYDGDGLPDVVMTQMGGIADLMRQRPDGTFEKATADVGMLCRPWQYAQQIDVTGDGRLDLVCPDRVGYPHRVWNTLPSRWQDVTDRMPHVPVVADSVVADFNNDGLMDIFLLGGVQTHPSGVGQSSDGRTLEARLMGETKGFDFIASGPVDFAIHQEGFGFGRIRIGAAAHVPESASFVLDPADPAVAGMPEDPGLTPILLIGYDPEEQRWAVQMRSRTEDGEQVWSEAYFVITAETPIRSVRAHGLWVTDLAASPTLLLNRGDGFEDVTAAAGLAEPLECVSVAAGDFDNDMDIDLYLACRQAAANIENILFENRGDGTFVRVEGAGGAAGPVGLSVSEGVGAAESVAVADYDLDGYLDLIVTNGLNLSPIGVGGPLRLYRNLGGSNHWLQLDLAATASHREAVGARVEVRAGGAVQTRIRNGSYHRWSHDHTRMHFGLAEHDRADVTIHWPSGLTELHENVPADGVYRAIEGEGIELVDHDVAPYPCRLPEDPIRDLGVFVAKRCFDNVWQLRAASGGSEERITYRGRVVSDQPLPEAVRPRGLEEGIDEFEVAEQEIRFVFHTRGEDWDGIDFRLAHGSEACLIIEEPAAARVHLGVRRERMPTEFELETAGPCPGRDPLPRPDDEDPAGSGQDGAGDDTSPGSDEPSDPEPSDPGPSDPGPSDPEPSDPEPSDPEPSDPEPSDPDPSVSRPPDEPPGEDGSAGGSGAVSAGSLLLASLAWMGAAVWRPRRTAHRTCRQLENGPGEST